MCKIILSMKIMEVWDKFVERYLVRHFCTRLNRAARILMVFVAIREYGSHICGKVNVFLDNVRVKPSIVNVK